MNDFLEDMVKEKIRELKDAYEAVIFAMAKLAEYRDDDTGKHLERVRAFSKLLAKELARWPGYERKVNKDFIRTIYHASPLHDVGKVAIPDKILLKPGKLTPEEFEVVKTVLVNLKADHKKDDQDTNARIDKKTGRNTDRIKELEKSNSDKPN